MSKRELDPEELQLTIDEKYAHFRMVARELWNCGFRPVSQLRDHYSQIAFQRIVESLFQAIVLRPEPLFDGTGVGFRFPLDRDSPFRIEVVPMSSRTQMFIDNLSGGFGDPTVDAGCGSIDLEFVGPFDWDTSGIRDFQYIMVRIVSWSEDREFEGRLALVEPFYVSLKLIE